MFSSPAFAATGAAPSGSGLAMLMQFAPLIFIFVIFYFLLIRPQQKRAADHRKTIEAVKKGDLVVTAGGVRGKVIKVEDEEVEVEIAPNVRVKIVRATLSGVTPSGSSKPAND
ncbi:preprotein translocase subunit YajC [Sphingomonas montanisoli]|uniref:Sec translocon accessory complex subunit YajC n=1 Tax=Sphingomonas montanisoli TaxID=2606412 RepID=A0A5D9C571_9SPHN|nr:preprotein translocase subunit YajC [Sphingomonas montanisoli]TZG25135.1 preprotein translocase subunit YajC [Sphingomonas montanisoli]